MKRLFLHLGFRNGFSLHYQGPAVNSNSSNHHSALQHSDIVNAKLQKELLLNRIAGPFASPPFNPFIISPIGVVPKKEVNSYRIIHDLSYPPEASVNCYIPREYCSVSYETLDHVIDHITKYGTGALMAKADIESAFSIIPITPNDYHLLGFTWNGSYYYGKRLPMGSSISCSTFEELSRAVQWILINVLHVTSVSHILDDFIFIGPPISDVCKKSLSKFICLAEDLSIPLNTSKTVLPTTLAIMHGIEINTITMVASLPEDKLFKAKSEVHALIHKSKTTLREIQSVIGFLNFACRVVTPGRAFLRRLYNLTKKAQKKHHHVRIDKEAQKDLRAWDSFLESFNGKTLLLKQIWNSSDIFNLYTDSAKSCGYAAVFGDHWCAGPWPDNLNHHITLLELYPIVLALKLWGYKLQDKCVEFYTDNLAVVYIINNQTSKDNTIMTLVRLLVLRCLKYNILFCAKHIPGKFNVTADLLSRFQVQAARRHKPTLEQQPLQLPNGWDLSSLLLRN